VRSRDGVAQFSSEVIRDLAADRRLDRYLRWEAAEALATSGHRAGVEIVHELAIEGPPEERRRAAAVVARHGTAAELHRLAADAAIDWDTVRLAAETLLERGSAADSIGFVRDETIDPNIRIAFAEALLDRGDDEIVDVLQTLAATATEPSARRMAARALAGRGSTEPLRALVAAPATSAAERHERNLAAEALATYGTPDDLRWLAFRADADKRAVGAALRALVHSHAAEVLAFADDPHGDADTRRIAAAALAARGHESGLRVLYDIATDASQSSDVRRLAVRSLCLYSDSTHLLGLSADPTLDAVDRLDRLARDHGVPVGVRRDAAEALASAGDEDGWTLYRQLQTLAS
jgi:HEAT repeat protein